MTNSVSSDSTQLGLPFQFKTRPTSVGPAIFISRGRRLRSTEAFDTYWRFAAERQEVFFRRLSGSPPPWSTDPILEQHRFTNAYRASDRVSQFLIRTVQYAGEQDPKELFFRTLLFKVFNRIETWKLLERELGGIHAREFSVRQYESVLDAAMRSGQRVYSSAYIMPPVRSSEYHAKHSGHLRLLERMLHDDLPGRVGDAGSLREAFELLRSYPAIGDFLAYQYVIDLNYSQIMNFSEMDFVVAGPGARRGIRKCFSDTDGLTEEEVIRYVAEAQSTEFFQRGYRFRDLWGRPLQLVDCQNLFCEVDKYSRVAHPHLNGGDGRKRIKQRFHPSGLPPQPWYPPKWRLNSYVESSNRVTS